MSKTKPSPFTSDIRIERQLAFSVEPRATAEYYISYAWRDQTKGGVRREKFVDHLCAVAEGRGVRIVFDKKDLGLGERISTFMRRIGKADRVYVVLSDKYLKSPFCMFELFEIWRNSREEDDEFLRRIRVYTLRDAKIWKPRDRIECAAHWKRECAELENAVEEHGIDTIGGRDFAALRLMRRFANDTGDILATIADIVQPRDFKDFVKYGFDDPPEED